VDVSIRFTPGSLSKEARCELRMQSAASGGLSSRDTSSSRCSSACPAAEPGPAQSAPAGQMQDNVAMAGSSSSHVSEKSYTGRYEGALLVAFTTGQQQVCGAPCATLAVYRQLNSCLLHGTHSSLGMQHRWVWNEAEPRGSNAWLCACFALTLVGGVVVWLAGHAHLSCLDLRSGLP
jgi:hypothetical protein